jgi:Na+/H+ antiporter NhaD/arsenite permease-like protein
MNVIIATFIFAGTLSILFTDKWHRVVVSGLGASAMVAAGHLFSFYNEERAIHAIDFETLGLLMGMMILVSLLRKTGFFEFVAINVAQRSSGSVVRLLLTLGLTTSLLSMVLDNVTTVVLMAPMTVLIAELLAISPVPLLMSQAIFSNTGGMATLVGDPPNILIGAAAHLTFTSFLFHLGPIVLVTWIFMFFTLTFVFRRDLSAVQLDENRKQTLQRLKPEEALSNAENARRVLIVIGGVVVLFFLESALNITPAFAALTGAGVALAWTNHTVHEILQDVEWDVLLFFSGLFVMVGGLQSAGVLDKAADGLDKLHELSPLVLGLVVLWIMALLSAVIDNVPITIAVIPIVLSLDTQGVDIRPLWWAIALGAGLGGNATPIGSTANVVVMSVSERTAYRITDRQWLRDAVPASLVSMIVASILYIILFDFLRMG